MERRQRPGEIRDLYGVAGLDLFGSAVGEGFDPEDSDLGFVVSFDSRIRRGCLKSTSV